MKKIAISVAAVALANMSFADTYFFVGAKGSSWQDKTNYRLSSRTGSIPANLPGADDYVLTGAANSSSTNDVEITAEDIDFISGLKAIGARYAVLTLNVATNAHLGCAIAGLSDTLGVARHGEIVKKGAGDLYLDSVGNVLSGDNPADYLTCRFTVEQGAVYAMNVTASYSSGSLGVVNVGDNASFHLPTCTTSTLHIEGFEGDGDISYDGSLAKLQLYIDGNINGPHVFNGTLSGKIKLILQNGVGQVFGGVSTFSGNDDLTVTAGASGTTTLGFSVGNEDRTAAQSLGTYAQMKFSQPSGESAPRLLYTGTVGDTLAKKILCYSGNAGIIDGGDVGGLTIAGSSGGLLRYSNSSSNPGVARFVFQGDGATENVYDTVLDNRVNTSERGTSAAQPLTIVKKGAGIWKFTARTDHYETGTYAIDEGTLRFGSLAPVGTSCSLGLGTMTYDPDYSYKGSTPDASKKVGYHIRLGGGTTAGTLEYVGAADAVNDSRIIAVNGNGTLKNSSGHSFVQHGVVVAGDGSHTLTLDGVTEAGDITNTVGTLSVAVNAGEGTTRLTRDLSFNGSLSVANGHLAISNPTNYTYFRFTIKENMYDLYPDGNPNKVANREGRVRMSEFALFDETGRNLTTNLLVTASSVSELGEGQVCYVQGADKEGSLSLLFNDIGEALTADWCGQAPAALSSGDSDSWIVFAMRLPDTSRRVAAFDFVTAFRGPATKGGAVTDSEVDSWYAMAPRAYLLEGSLDGKDWQELYSESDHNANHIDYKTSSQRFWASSDGTVAFAFGSMQRSAGFDFTAPSSVQSEFGAALRNVSGVSVARGAELALVGDVAKISGLSFDAADGIGNFVNVTLADAGTIDFTNVASDGVLLPVDWSGWNNREALLNWTLTIDGAPTERFRLKLTSGGLKIDKIHGFTLIVR